MFSDITEASAIIVMRMVNRFLARCLMSQSAVPNESEDQTKSSLNIKTESEQEKAITCSLVPEKEEPHGFIKLAAEIFELLDRQLLCSKNRSIKDYLKRNLSDQEIVILTSILKDLDKELSRPVSWFVYGFLGTIIQVCNFITKRPKFLFCTISYLDTATRVLPIIQICQIKRKH